MRDEEYLTTITVGGRSADIGFDDYGQCYFIEWEEDGEKECMGLGSYNPYCLEEAFHFLDPLYRHVLRANLYCTPTEDDEELLRTYNLMFDTIYKEAFQ